MNALCLLAYRSCSLPTLKALLDLHNSPVRDQWRINVETGDALLSRARSIAASQWLVGCPDDDVLVMTDDDFYFTPEGLMVLADHAREKRAIVAGVTPLRSGEYTAIVPLDGSAEEPWREATAPPQRIRWAGGLVAYHRSVFETLRTTLPVCDEHNPRVSPFWPFFHPAAHATTTGLIYLSEDYACHERARQAGIDVWVHPACQVAHEATLLVTSATMPAIRELHRDPTVGGAYALTP